MARGDSRVYVFALAAPGLPSRMRVLGRTLHTLTVRPRIDAVIERRTEAIEPAVDSLREQHELVSRLMIRARALLPAQFGSLMEEHTLREAVTKHEAEIVQALDRVRGQRQMTIRVFGSPDLPFPPEKQAATGTAYLERRRARSHHVPPEVDVIRTLLQPLVSAERIQPGTGRLRVTVYHLVPTRNVAAYKRKAAALEVVPHRLMVSGPWPPFAFAPELQ